MYDFSNEQEQTSMNYGPVPSGSCVILSMTVLEAAQAVVPSDQYITQARSGLMQIRCQFEVAQGSYQGVKFFQGITLPAGMQRINLTAGQAKACGIGGSQIKAICQSANKKPTIKGFGDMNGWKFAARLRLNKQPSEKEGRVYWHNEIDRIIVPTDAEYNQIKQSGEIINEGGAVSMGNYQPDGGYDPGYVEREPAFPQDAAGIDDCPF